MGTEKPLKWNLNPQRIKDRETQIPTEYVYVWKTTLAYYWLQESPWESSGGGEALGVKEGPLSGQREQVEHMQVVFGVLEARGAVILPKNMQTVFKVCSHDCC